MKKVKSDGFVSLFTTIMISLLLLVITVSLVSLEALQLRKSEDSEQTLRAYYAAEAGVEDAVSKVLNNPALRVDQPCQANVAYDIPGAAGWTCQQITFSGSPKGKLEADAATTVDPGHIVGGYKSVVIGWNSNASVGGPFTVPLALPSQAGYAAPAPPLELSIVSYPSGVTIKQSDICPNIGGCSVKLQNALIVPRGNTGAYQVNFPGLLGAGQWNANCGTTARPFVTGGNTYTGYNCYAVLTNLPNGYDFLFRIRSRYLKTNYEMTFRTNADGSGALVPVPDGTATIDVTAKAGQTYRRVITKLPLSSGAEASLNYVIYSDTNVCKNFTVIDNAAPPPNTGC